MLSGKTVVIVHAEAQVRSVIANLVKNQLNASVIREFNQPVTGLKYLLGAERKEPVDLIIAGWESTGQVGLEMLRQVRTDPRLKNAPYVIVTPRNDRDSIVEALKSGVSGYVVIPFSAAAFIHRVNVAMGNEDRRSMPRINAGGMVATVVFAGSHRYEVKMDDFSQTGCQVSSPRFEHCCKGVYEPTVLKVVWQARVVEFKGELVRISRDTEAEDYKKLMKLGIQFTELDEAHRNTLVAILKHLKEK